MEDADSRAGNEFDRREFIKLGAAGMGAAAAGAVLSGCAATAATTSTASYQPATAFGPAVVEPLERVRIGFVGVGLQGSSHVRNLLRIEGAEIRALCDIVPEKVERAQRWVVEAGFEKPAGYSNGELDFRNLCERDDLDLVMTATPWEWHVPVCVAAMVAGKHAATEVPAAVTIEECWQLVETAERTNRHCQMLENVCYMRTELLVFHMVRKGLFGEILHGEAGYLHDLRAIKFENANEGLWRRQHSIERNGNLYPTHGLGPLAQYMNINRGDRFDYLVSMSGPSRGLYLYAEREFGVDDPRRKETYKLGDVNISLIMTRNGRTITLYHDTNLPRPYSRINLVQGTKGLFQGWPERIYVEGRSPAHRWEELDAYYEEFEHPLWKARGGQARGAGHGGADWIEDYRLINALLNGLPTDQDVYDAAAWSVVSALSERSVADRSRPQDFPDFTRGAWKKRPPLGIIEG